MTSTYAKGTVRGYVGLSLKYPGTLQLPEPEPRDLSYMLCMTLAVTLEPGIMNPRQQAW